MNRQLGDLGAWFLAAVLAVSAFPSRGIGGGGVLAQAAPVPRFEVDPSFPSLPPGKVLGDMSSVAVDARDHVWMIHRPRTVAAEQRANAAPAVLEFEASGKFVAGWGGPAAGYEWPEREHGIYVA